MRLEERAASANALHISFIWWKVIKSYTPNQKEEEGVMTVASLMWPDVAFNQNLRL